MMSARRAREAELDTARTFRSEGSPDPNGQGAAFPVRMALRQQRIRTGPEAKTAGYPPRTGPIKVSGSQVAISGKTQRITIASIMHST